MPIHAWYCDVIFPTWICKISKTYITTRVRIRLKIVYSNFLFIHHEAKDGIWFYIIKTTIQAEICVAKCLKCGAFYSAIQSNSHLDHGQTFRKYFTRPTIQYVVFSLMGPLTAHDTCTRGEEVTWSNMVDDQQYSPRWAPVRWSVVPGGGGHLYLKLDIILVKKNHIIRVVFQDQTMYTHIV